MFVPARVLNIDCFVSRKAKYYQSYITFKVLGICHTIGSYEYIRLVVTITFVRNAAIKYCSTCLTFKTAMHEQSQVQCRNLLINVKLPLECCSQALEQSQCHHFHQRNDCFLSTPLQICMTPQIITVLQTLHHVLNLLKCEKKSSVLHKTSP